MTVADPKEMPAHQALDSEPLRAAREQLELDRIRSERRKLRLAAAEEYIGFGIQKLAGLGALGLGVMEAVDPSLVSAIHVDPLTAAGAGAAVLLGKAGIRVLKPLFDALAK